jgi:hypothetical protein
VSREIFPKREDRVSNWEARPGATKGTRFGNRFVDIAKRFPRLARYQPSHCYASIGVQRRLEMQSIPQGA